MNEHEKRARVHEVHGEQDLRDGQPELANARFHLACLERIRAEKEEK